MDTDENKPNPFDEGLRVGFDILRSSVNDVRETLPSLDDVIDQAVLLPGVSVLRTEFLRTALATFPRPVVDAAIRTTPVKAGIPLGKLSRIAGKALGKEARRTTVASMAAGIPGGAAAAFTIPADIVQMYGHLIRAIQILSYLYGWGDLCHVETEKMSDTTRKALLIFLGVMTGDERAVTELNRLAPLRGTFRMAFAVVQSTEVTRISDALSTRMLHRLTGQVVGKSIPLAGAVISGTMSYGGFSDMWKKLRKVLAEIG